MYLLPRQSRLLRMLSLAMAALPQPASASPNDFAQQPLDGLLSGQWLHEFSTPDHSSCTISRLSAFEQVDGPVSFSRSAAEHPEVPKLSAINATVWEQWEFDGVADSGWGSVLMGFSRDPSYGFFGQGNLRVEFYLTLTDGTVIQELEYTKHSTIIDCPDSVSGVWNSSDRLYAFRVPKDMGSAEVWWDTGRERGSLSLESLTPPHLADGKLWPLKKEDQQAQNDDDDDQPPTKMAPGLYFNQPIAGGKMTADIQIGKKRMHISGRGGHSRLWAEDSWFKICHGWHIVRGFIGPYTLSYWQPVSRLADGVSFFSAQLFKDGKLVATSQVGTTSPDADHVLYDPDFTGNVSGRLADKSTGRVISFVSPASGRSWRFLHAHHFKMFEMRFGGGKGLTGFVDHITGGEVGTGEQFVGKGISEQVNLPDEIKTWQIWVVYGIGFLGRWKNTLTNFVSSIMP